MQTILLVDDDHFNRDGVRLFLSSENFEVREAGDEASAWQLAQAAGDGLVAAVVDISIPPDAQTAVRPDHRFGLALAKRLKAAYPSLGVVLFSAHADQGPEVWDLVQQGVRGLAYKLKGTQPKDLLSAIQGVIAGRVIIDPEIRVNRKGLAEALIERLTSDERPWVVQAADNIGELTPREKDIANRLAASHNTEGIAEDLVISTKTTENYITHVYDKLGLNEMAQAAPHLRKVVILAKACMINDLR